MGVWSFSKCSKAIKKTDPALRKRLHYGVVCRIINRYRHKKLLPDLVMKMRAWKALFLFGERWVLQLWLVFVI